MTASRRVWSIGHSTHSAEAFGALLRGHGVVGVADIRTVPRSRRLPQYQAEAMAAWLPAQAGVAYAHLRRLGGWRRPRPDSPNDGWRNRSFRGYADYALGDEFAAGLEELTAMAACRATAMMCSEALWWRCHRRLVADRLLVAGWEVLHIGSDGRVGEHALTAFGVVGDDGRVRYPAR